METLNHTTQNAIAAVVRREFNRDALAALVEDYPVVCADNAVTSVWEKCRAAAALGHRWCVVEVHTDPKVWHCIEQTLLNMGLSITDPPLDSGYPQHARCIRW